MPDEPEPVFFLLPDGTEISDDPRWKAKQFRDQIERASANNQSEADYRAKLDSGQFEEDAKKPEESVEDQVAATGSDEPVAQFAAAFNDMSVEDLKAEAAERNIDIRAAGARKKSDLVELLANHDAQEAASKAE